MLALIRILIASLLVGLLLLVFLVLNPGILRALVRWLPVPGVVDIPAPGATPAPPAINLPPGAVPSGFLALWGEYSGGQFGCGFLLGLDDGRRVGVSAAHATAPLLPHVPGRFRAIDGTTAAALEGQVARGHTFIRDDFTTDYVLWGVAEVTHPESLLRPDPRGQGQPGESVLLLSPFEADSGGSKGWPGVVMRAAPTVTWVQLEASLDPRGLSGCPVVSLVTGRLVGMAVAGQNTSPSVIGLHPVASLVEKARQVAP